MGTSANAGSGMFWCIGVVVVVWAVLDVDEDELGMVVVVLHDIVRDLTLLMVIGGILHVRFDRATRPWLLTILPLLCRAQRRGDDAGWWWSSPFATLSYALDIADDPNSVKRIFEKCLPGELSWSTTLENDSLTPSYL